ncbi:MAG: pyruvate carboxyltransferase [Deltaproteobacteria bacterium RBG_19FT_COMBO_52_11]|nr:MAG: pyruvate carboxyltransferase [Deltaproteobacteria bacterium RBG_19FT_COMBO_52_11]
MKQPWKTDKWFVSPWNYEPEVTSKFQFPPAKDIKIHDITLRDGEQQAGIAYTLEDKMKIAKALAEAGVHRIETGMPAVSKEDERAIREIVQANFGPEIFAFSRCMVADVKLAKECGVQGVVVEIPSSEHIIKHAYGWELQKAIDLSIEATLLAKELGLYTVWFPIDASRADMNWFLDLIEKISTEGHMDALAVVDTFGGISPHAIPHLIKRVRERVKKPLEPHFHDDFGMGVANTLMARACGCTVAHTTVTGIGERAGNAAMEELVLALLTMYGIDIGIKTEKFYSLSQLVRELSHTQIPSNRPIVGETLLSVESGIVTSWVRRCRDENPLELGPFLPSLVGQRPVEIVLGKSSGIDSVAEWLEKIGGDASQEQREAIVLKVKDASIKKKGLLTEQEFKKIVDSVVHG